LEDVLGDKFQPLKFNGSWLKNDQLLITDGNDNLQILDAPSGTLQPLLYNESIVSQTKLLLTFRINGSNIFVHVILLNFTINSRCHQDQHILYHQTIDFSFSQLITERLVDQVNRVRFK
jgi:hypothetical protein